MVEVDHLRGLDDGLGYGRRQGQLAPWPHDKARWIERCGQLRGALPALPASGIGAHDPVARIATARVAAAHQDKAAVAGHRHVPETTICGRFVGLLPEQLAVVVYLVEQPARRLLGDPGQARHRRAAVVKGDRISGVLVGVDIQVEVAGPLHGSVAHGANHLGAGVTGLPGDPVHQRAGLVSVEQQVDGQGPAGLWIAVGGLVGVVLAQQRRALAVEMMDQRLVGVGAAVAVVEQRPERAIGR